jgi:hypothetical protein
MRVHVQRSDVNETYCGNLRITGPQITLEEYVKQIMKEGTTTDGPVCLSCEKNSRFDTRVLIRNFDEKRSQK